MILLHEVNDVVAEHHLVVEWAPLSWLFLHVTSEVKVELTIIRGHDEETGEVICSIIIFFEFACLTLDKVLNSCLFDVDQIESVSFSWLAAHNEGEGVIAELGYLDKIRQESEIVIDDTKI